MPRRSRDHWVVFRETSRCVLAKVHTGAAPPRACTSSARAVQSPEEGSRAQWAPRASSARSRAGSARSRAGSAPTGAARQDKRPDAKSRATAVKTAQRPGTRSCCAAAPRCCVWISRSRSRRYLFYFSHATPRSSSWQAHPAGARGQPAAQLPEAVTAATLARLAGRGHTGRRSLDLLE